MLSYILIWSLDALCLALYLQFSGLVLGYKPRNHTAVNILLVLLTCLPSVWLSNRGGEGSVPYPLRLALFVIYTAGTIGSYFIVFRKVNIRLLYMYFLPANLPQIFYNTFRVFIKNDARANLLSFAAVSVMMGLIILIINKRGSKDFIQDLVRSLPARVYAIILAFFLVASIHVMAENELHSEVYISIFRLLSMAALIAASLSVAKISISESEKRANVEQLSKQVENQIAYYEKINKIYGEFRRFRHDYKNHVLCLRGLIAAGKTDEALEYMETMGDMSSVEKNRYHTGNVIIDALLDDKSEKAENARAELIFTGTVPDKGISNADLCIIIANAIDNAIEACAKDDTDTAKEIKLRADVKQGYFFFRASNPVSDVPDIKDKRSIATSKSDRENHGFGISNIVMTAEKYEGSAEITAEDGIFTLSVEMHLRAQ